MSHRTDILRNNLLKYGVAVILVLIPLHAFLSVWLANFLGNYTVVRLWKEVLLIFLFTLAISAILANKNTFSTFKLNKPLKILAICIVLYILMFAVFGAYSLAFGNIKVMAIGYSIISATRFLLFFIICLVAGVLHKEWFKKHMYILLFVPASVVVVFGLLQATVLPVDFLKHFGYNDSTIKSYIAVDEKVEYARTQSTLRGPNPLGAYLVVIISALVAVIMRQQKIKWYWILTLLSTVIVLYTTYSRSAYIGLILAVGAVVFMAVKTNKSRKVLLYLALSVALMAGAGLYVLRDNDTVQNVIFHTDEHSASQASSNEHRTGALQLAVQDIFGNPVGGGPGSAGPASVYNNSAVLSENYFLQIGQEVGIVGLALFIAICALLVLQLWQLRNKTLLAPALIAAFLGLIFVNLVSHAWADDTLAYIWWGFAGLVVGMYGIKDGKEKSNT